MTAKHRLDTFFNNDPLFAKKSLGQHFLISDYAINLMIQKLKQVDSSKILEIGPGPGALTDLIIPMQKDFKVIELDHFFCNYWKEKGLQVIDQDALLIPWEMFSEKQDTTLISNLPYQISSSIVIDRSVDETLFSCMILMFQKEVAQKIRAKNKSSEFGLLSLVAQTFWEIEVLCDLGPRDFIPAPKIASRVLTFKPKANSIKNKRSYLSFCKAAFKQKRKMLKSNLMQYTNLKELDLLNLMAELKINKTARAEELNSEDFIRLYHRLGNL